MAEKLSVNGTELSSTARYGGNQLKGVQIADTLYLPEKVEITGDTVILAKKTVFEGRHPVIKGNHTMSFLTIEIEGAIGTTLDVANRSSRLAEPCE